MRRMFTACGASWIALLAAVVPAHGETARDFGAWLDEVRQEAQLRGISAGTLDAALRGVAPIPRVIELDRFQPEFTQTVSEYLGKRVTQQRIDRGRELLDRHASLLDEVHERYGIPPRYLVAFWGLESNFGETQGNFPVIGALATLAYDGRRSDRFRRELFDALAILEEGAITAARMNGSWAGAMGQPQFMPSTFRAYAIDGDGDGRRDIWATLPDVFNSAANFLNKLGWRRGEPWGREVLLPADFDLALVGRSNPRPVEEWEGLGVRAADGTPIPEDGLAGTIILPAGHRGPAFLLYRNFHVIMGWNPATLYAISVGHLADRLDGQGPLQTLASDEPRPIGRKEALELQALLTRLGFDTGEPDGVVGPVTRRAVQDYQASRGLVADGFPTADLLTGLRQQVEGGTVPRSEGGGAGGSPQ